MADTLKRLKIIIIVLSILLGLSLTALAGVIIYGRLDSSSGSAVVPDNFIEPTSSGAPEPDARATPLRTDPVLLCPSVPSVALSANVPVTTFSKTLITSDSAEKTTIALYKNHTADSEPFHLTNMLPGDSETNAYLVAVSHKGTVTVHFRADIRTGYEKLSEVLKCKVVLRGETQTLYDGLMCDMPESISHHISSVSGKTTELTYDITVYLDTSVGNAYQNQELVADFRWWIDDTSDDGEPVYPPQTGDHSHFCLWFWIAMISLLINIILLWPKCRRKKGEKEDEKANEQ